MKKRQFKAESKKLLDLMIHSIYTNKEIFLRELISNASDAIDKLYYRSLTDKKLKVKRDSFEIKLAIDKEKRELTIQDNGCGMTEEELENNLGTIAQSGSLAFKEAAEKKKDIDIIGQFGVGFYSAFMVSDEVSVTSHSVDSDKAYRWTSKGADGYTIEECDKEEIGTTITLKIKEDTEEEKYSEFLEPYRIQGIVKKYSDYIRYPIKMDIEHRHLKEGSKDEYESHIEEETLNSMIPIWKKNKKDLKQEEYNQFYQEKFFDYEEPLRTIHTFAEGQCSYYALLYIPSHASYDYYSKEFEKGLSLYANGVMIMDKCSDLLPDYFSFVKGLVDSNDLSLNISREMLQQDRKLQLIAKNIEKKIKSELMDLLENDRENYEKFFKAFGMQLKFGIYNNYGMDKDKLKDLMIFYSSTEKKMVTFGEYISRMKENQDKIYYACGETVDKIDDLPQVEKVKDKGYEILYLTDYVDEFVMQTLTEYDNKKFVNVSTDNLDLDTEEEKESLKKQNEEAKDMFASMKEALKTEIQDVRFTNRLKNHPVCLTSEGAISLEMEKVINAMPTDEKVKATTVMEINATHPIAEKLKDLYQHDKKELESYTKILYAQARLIEGLPITNPTEITNLVCEVMSK
jgi:chaperone protein htpG